MKKRLFFILGTLVIAAMVFSTGAAAQSQNPSVQVAPAQVAPLQVIDKGLKFSIDTVYSADSLNNAIRMPDGRLSVIVQLADSPLATYAGGVQGLRATAPQALGRVKLDASSPDSQAYVQYLKGVQTKFIDQLKTVAPSAQADFTYQTAFNGISMKVNKAEISSIAMMSDVVKIYPNQRKYLEMDASLPLIKAQAFWTRLGGQANAGKGIRIADVDTGLDSKNPMFSGTGFTPLAGYPKGFCVTNPADPDFQCNNKVIVGRWYFDPALIGGTTVLDPKEVMTPFGINSHGTHTAGTASGDPVTATVSGVSFNISGVAPAAYLMVYKGLFGVITNGTPGGSGTDSMLIAALDDALADGADVINNSWGDSSIRDPNKDVFKPVIAAITAAGTLAVFAAGNSGPGSGTVDCPGCQQDALTAAASTTNRILANPFNITGPGTVPPALTGIGAFSSGQVISAQLSAEIRYNAGNDLGCVAFPANFFQGAIALIHRGTCTFAVKIANAIAAGAVAVVIFNNAGGPPVAMAGVPTNFPSFMIDQNGGMAVRNWIVAAATPATATIDATLSKVIDNTFQDVVAGFSSVGPDGDPSFLKPDIAAPGVNILSASSPALISGATEPWYEFLQGTSMATPHMTGSAALVIQQHPDWTPLQVKTALTSTAVQTLKKPDGVTPADPFNMGSGRVDLDRASQAALTFSKSSFANPNCFLTCSWSLTLKNVTSASATWNAVTTTSKKALGLKVTPSHVVIPVAGSIDVTVTADSSQLLPGSYAFGSVVWQDASGTSPSAYLPVAVASGPSSNPSILTKSVDKAAAASGDQLTYTIKVSNPYSVQTTFTVEDQLPSTLTYVDGSATGGLTYNPATRKLSGSAALAPFQMDVQPTGAATLYTPGNPADSLDLTANCPVADPTCDEVVFTISPVDFFYLGTHYTSLRVSSNGFMAPGTTLSSSASTPQNLPNTAAPNNVIAPLWTDLDFAHAGAKWLVWGTATDTVVEWQNANEFGHDTVLYNFEIWIKDGTNQITFAYGPLNADISSPTPAYKYGVGIENSDGTAGKSYFFFGGTGAPLGTAPVMGTDLSAINNLSSALMTFKAVLGMTPIDKPVVANVVSEVSNFDAKVNMAEAYTVTNEVVFPMIFKLP